MRPRNSEAIAAIERAQVPAPFSFTIAGDSGFVPNEAGDAVFVRMLEAMGRLEPRPAFFANLGDFAGPGTRARHEHYADMIAHCALPSVAVTGNHELDDASGAGNFADFIGAANFSFTCAHALFVGINSYQRPNGAHGPEAEDLAFLEAALEADEGRHPVRIVLMHMPPNMGGHYAPYVESVWAFTDLEAEFMRIVRAHNVRLACCAHLIGYDLHTEGDLTVCLSGGGGGYVNGVFGQVMPDNPPHSAAFPHFVQITVGAAGELSGRVFHATEDGEVREEPAFRWERPA